jgi:hypothetical protein
MGARPSETTRILRRGASPTALNSRYVQKGVTEVISLYWDILSSPTAYNTT